MKIKIMTIKDFNSIYALWKEAGLNIGNLKVVGFYQKYGYSAVDNAIVMEKNL